jgi:hypothetical protein
MSKSNQKSITRLFPFLLCFLVRPPLMRGDVDPSSSLHAREGCLESGGISVSMMLFW